MNTEKQMSTGEEVRDQLADLLYDSGWRSPCDAQWEGLLKALPDIRALLQKDSDKMEQAEYLVGNYYLTEFGNYIKIVQLEPDTGNICSKEGVWRNKFGEVIRLGASKSMNLVKLYKENN